MADDDESFAPTSPWWLSGTPLEPEHHRLMRRRAAPIPWDKTTAAELAPAERARLAGTWMRRSQAEYLAVSTFSVLAMDLVAAMAPADVLSLCLRAGIDEVRHAELCIRMAEIYSGTRQLPPPGMSSLPDDPNRPRLHQALANTMLVSCVSETYATTVLSATRDLTEDPTAQEVLTSIYSDEVMHARLGWAYLRYAIDQGGQGAIDAAAKMVPIALRGVANVVERERPEGAVTEAVRRHGLMTPEEERDIFSTCVSDVLVPGFTALGISVGTALDDYGPAWAAAPHPAMPAPPMSIGSYLVSRSRLLVAALAVACGPKPISETPAKATLGDKVVAEFERTTLAGQDAWIEQFDFTAVGEYEILLHRYDLLGRLTNLTPEEIEQYKAEDGTPYPPERERKNVGNFYALLAQRTVGTGGCTARPPRFHYNQLMGEPFEPLPAGNESHEALRTKVNAYLADGQGGVIALRCTGGKGSLALVYTRRSNPRGYDLITIYDDGSR